MELIDGLIRKYDWGSQSSIPSLLGRPEDGDPWAELWLGAHPSAPSLVGAAAIPLTELVASDPQSMLGAQVAERFGALPFLLKVLAAAAPLSLQAHPSIPQAEAGFARENAAGVAIDAPNRSFRDRQHKPELICALTEFEALCGFRDPEATLDLLGSIATPELDSIRSRLAADPSDEGLRQLLEYLLLLDSQTAAPLSNAVVAACAAGLNGPSPKGRWSNEHRLAVGLGERYPGDVGVVTALLLNYVTLVPGEALFLGAGNLHAYLRGTGIEIMANSDNVLRGGLTPKHVDVATLLDVVDVTPIVPDIQRPTPVDGVVSYRIPVPEFSLSQVEVSERVVVGPGPAIILCTDGVVNVGSLTLDRGAAAWLSAADGVVEATGRGTVFCAGVGTLTR